MKTTPIAEFLARKAGQEPRAQPSALNPRRVTGVNDDSEPEFKRSGLGAALSRRAPERPPLVRPILNELPRREPLPREPPRPPEPRDDFEARLSEAYHRGVQEGLDAGKAETVTERALERADLQKRAVIEKLDFQMNEYVRIAESLANGFAELEQRVARASAQLLQPLLEAQIARRVVDELSENVRRLARAPDVALLRVRGPEKLLSLLKTRIEGLAVGVEYVEDTGVEITVSAGATEIRSELQAWRRLIDDIVENG